MHQSMAGLPKEGGLTFYSASIWSTELPVPGRGWFLRPVSPVKTETDSKKLTKRGFLVRKCEKYLKNEQFKNLAFVCRYPE